MAPALKFAQLRAEMELSREWLGKAAGWRAFQEGRKLHAAGRVLEVTQDEFYFSGLLQASPRPRKVRVKINTETDIDTHCTCAENRRDGAFCAHAVALILQALEGAPAPSSSQASSATSSNQPSRSQPSRATATSAATSSLAYEIQIRSCALEALRRQRPLSFSIRPIDAAPSESDEALAQWMSDLHLATDQAHALLQVSGPQLQALLLALGGHEQVLLGNESIEMPAARLKPSLEWHPPLTLRCSPAGEGWLQIGPDWWWISNQVWQAGPESSELHDALIGEGRAELEESALVARLDELADAFELHGEAFESLEFLPQTPHIRVHFEGSGGYLEAHPIAVYQDRELDILKPEQSPSWKPEGAEWGTYHTRNRSEEQEVVNFLQVSGFLPDEGEPTLRLRGEELVIDFLAGDFQAMPNFDWEVLPSTTLSKILSKIEVIQPSVREITSGEGWMELEISYPGSSGRNFALKDIQQVLRSGRRKFKLPNGKLGIIDQSACKDLETILQETSPRQTQANRYRVDSRHVPSLKRSVDHRAAETSSLKQGLRWVDAIQGQLRAELRPYQREGVAWLLNHCQAYGGALLADDMGLGKTLQSIALILAARKAKLISPGAPVLVVAPTSLLDNWQAELANFAPQLKTLIWHGSKRDERRNEIKNHDVLITSYGVLTRDRVLFRKSSWAMAFLDEASLVRNPDSEIAKACHALQSDYRIAITGTPVENSVRDLWSCFEFVLPSYFGPKKVFQERYEVPCRQTPPDPQALRLLRMRVEPHLLRRNKDQVATDLPAKQESIVWCGMSRTQSELYQRLISEGHEAIAEASKTRGPGGAKLQTLTTLLRLRQCCCDARLTGVKLPERLALEERSEKLLRLFEIIQELRNNGHKALIFSQFTSQLNSIAELLSASQIKFCRLDGSSRNRGEIVNEFQSNSGPDFFLISLKAGGYGLNLTAADVVIHVDPWWNPAAERQATDRAHRIGQSKPVTVYKLVTKGTVEEKILRLQQQKSEIAEASLGQGFELKDGPQGIDLDFERLIQR